MSTYHATLTIDKKTADRIEHDLNATSDFAKLYDKYDKNYTETYTAAFENGVEIDIKLCMGDNMGNDTNPLWTEAVLFVDNHEAGISEPGDELFGEWEMEYNGDDYIVNVITGD